jgi:hypothetical protein
MSSSPIQKQVDRVLNPRKSTTNLPRIILECVIIAFFTVGSIFLFRYVADKQSLEVPQTTSLIAREWPLLGGLVIQSNLVVRALVTTDVSLTQFALTSLFLVGWLPTLITFRREADDDDAIDGSVKLPRLRWPAQVSMSLLMGLLLVILFLVLLPNLRSSDGLPKEQRVTVLIVIVISSLFGAALVSYIMLYAKRLLWLILLGAGLFGGIFCSALLASNPAWFEHSVSFLGSLPSSYQIFTASISIVGIAAAGICARHFVRFNYPNQYGKIEGTSPRFYPPCL